MNFSCCINNASCSEKNYNTIFNLGNLPLGNAVESESHKGLWTNYLELAMCSKCKFVQTLNKVPNEKLANENFYVSSDSKAIQDNYASLVKFLPVAASLNPKSLIMEIGCGDASLLKMFYNNGFKNIIGIEPNSYSESLPFDIAHDFFDKKIIDRLSEEKKNPDLVILNSVIETIPDLSLFFNNLFRFVKPGCFVFIEVPDFFSYTSKKRIDAFSHLTSNWFTVSSFEPIASAYGFDIIHFDIDEYRDGSIRLLAKKTETTPKHCDSYFSFRNQELKRMNEEYFINFSKELNTLKNNILSCIQEIKNEGSPLYSYGAGLKAATIINWLGFSKKDIIAAVDIDLNKQGKYIPNTGIPIMQREILFSPGKKSVIVNALHHSEEVLKYLKENLPEQSKIIIPLPDPHVITI